MSGCHKEVALSVAGTNQKQIIKAFPMSTGYSLVYNGKLVRGEIRQVGHGNFTASTLT